MTFFDLAVWGGKWEILGRSWGEFLGGVNVKDAVWYFEIWWGVIGN
jgi:hypothetical protein